MMIRFFILGVLFAGNLCSQISKEHLKDFKIISDMLDSAKKNNVHSLQDEIDGTY